MLLVLLLDEEFQRMSIQSYEAFFLILTQFGGKRILLLNSVRNEGFSVCKNADPTVILGKG